MDLLPGDGENAVVQIIAHRGVLEQLHVRVEIQLLPVQQVGGPVQDILKACRIIGLPKEALIRLRSHLGILVDPVYLPDRRNGLRGCFLGPLLAEQSASGRFHLLPHVGIHLFFDGHIQSFLLRDRLRTAKAFKHSAEKVPGQVQGNRYDHNAEQNKQDRGLFGVLRFLGGWGFLGLPALCGVFRLISHLSTPLPRRRKWPAAMPDPAPPTIGRPCR